MPRFLQFWHFFSETPSHLIFLIWHFWHAFGAIVTRLLELLLGVRYEYRSWIKSLDLKETVDLVPTLERLWMADKTPPYRAVHISTTASSSGYTWRPFSLKCLSTPLSRGCERRGLQLLDWSMDVKMHSSYCCARLRKRSLLGQACGHALFSALSR